jgi:hypothetical protein
MYSSILPSSGDHANVVIARKDNEVYLSASVRQSDHMDISRCRHEFEWWKRKIRLESNGETSLVDIEKATQIPKYQESPFQPSPWQSSRSFLFPGNTMTRKT